MKHRLRKLFSKLPKASESSDLAIKSAIASSMGFVFMLGGISEALAQAYKSPDSHELTKFLEELERDPRAAPQGAENFLKGFDEGSTPYLNKKTNIWHYGTHKIKPEVFDLIRSISTRNHFPLKIFLDIIARESSFKENAKSDTGACGLVQFMPATLYETILRHGQKIPALAKYNLEHRVVKKREAVQADTGATRYKLTYEPASQDDAKLIEKLCNDPEFNLEMGMQYKLQITATLQKFLNNNDKGPDAAGYYPLKAHELYLGFFAGPGAASKMLRRLRDGHDDSVLVDFPVSGIASKTNQALLYKIDEATGRPVARKVSELLREIALRMGHTSLESIPVLPDMRGHIFAENRKTLFQPPGRSLPASTPKTIQDLLERDQPR